MSSFVRLLRRAIPFVATTTNTSAQKNISRAFKLPCFGASTFRPIGGEQPGRDGFILNAIRDAIAVLTANGATLPANLDATVYDALQAGEECFASVRALQRQWNYASAQLPSGDDANLVCWYGAYRWTETGADSVAVVVPNDLRRPSTAVWNDLMYRCRNIVIPKLGVATMSYVFGGVYTTPELNDLLVAYPTGNFVAYTLTNCLTLADTVSALYTAPVRAVIAEMKDMLDISDHHWDINPSMPLMTPVMSVAMHAAYINTYVDALQTTIAHSTLSTLFIPYYGSKGQLALDFSPLDVVVMSRVSRLQSAAAPTAVGLLHGGYLANNADGSSYLSVRPYRGNLDSTGTNAATRIFAETFRQPFGAYYTQSLGSSGTVGNTSIVRYDALYDGLYSALAINESLRGIKTEWVPKRKEIVSSEGGIQVDKMERNKYSNKKDGGHWKLKGKGKPDGSPKK